jgi:hypothetical protein
MRNNRYERFNEITSNKITKSGIGIMSQNQINTFTNYAETRNLRCMMLFSEFFPDYKIIVPLARQLSWSQFATDSGNDNSDFRFQLTAEEYKVLRSQIVTSSSEREGWHYLPYAFTEQGVSMLSTVLESETAYPRSHPLCYP